MYKKMSNLSKSTDNLLKSNDAQNQDQVNNGKNFVALTSKKKHN